MTEIIPAILPQTFSELEHSLAQLAGATPWIQLDICDGLFVTNRTWPMNASDRSHFAEILKGDDGLPYWQHFNFEVDLMTHSPEKHLSNWIAAGVTRAVIHLESRHVWEDIKSATGDSLELGLAIDLDPPYEKLHAYITRVDYIQIMGIARPGVQGTDLDDRVYELIKRVRSDFPDVTIQIDGGVNLENARTLLDAGADRLIVGSKIVHASLPKEALKQFQNV